MQLSRLARILFRLLTVTCQYAAEEIELLQIYQNYFI
jgi:hypothetical protein